LAQRFASHPGANLGSPPAATVEAWCNAFIASLAAALELKPTDAEWNAAQLADIADRRVKYAGDAWTRLR
jgi:hypothetical protein